jgi:hypothetical protein
MKLEQVGRASETDAWLTRQEGKLLTDGNVDRVIDRTDGDVMFLRPDGSLLCAYLPGRLDCWRTRYPWATFHVGAFKESTREVRRAALVAASWSENRGARSGIAGWYDLPYPRVTKFTRDQPYLWRRLRWLLRHMDEPHRAACPDQYAAQAAVADATHPSYVIPGTIATTVTCNRDWWSPCHKDDGNLGLSVLTVLEFERYTGGLLVLPKWRLGFDVREKDVLIADLAREYHGNTLVVPDAGSLAKLEEAENDPAVWPFRVSVIQYFRAALRHALDPDTEYRRHRRLG